MIEVKEIKEQNIDDEFDEEMTALESEVKLSLLKMFNLGKERVKEGYEDGFEAGRAEAWDCARKLILSPWDCDGALGISTIHRFFNGLAPYDVLMEYSAKDVKILIDMLNEKGKDINAPTKKDVDVAIGDEVRNLWGTVGMVVGTPTQDHPNVYSVAWWDVNDRRYWTENWERDEFVLTNNSLLKKKEEK